MIRALSSSSGQAPPSAPAFPPEVRTTQIYRGAIPFIVIQLIGLSLIVIYPELVTWALR